MTYEAAYEAADENQPLSIREDPPKAETTTVEVIRPTALGGVVLDTHTAGDWTVTEDGDLQIYDGTNCIAQYAKGAWVYIKKVGG